jgi:hypothetical protein
MKELKLGPDGILPIMEIDLENKPIILYYTYSKEVFMLIRLHKGGFFRSERTNDIYYADENIYQVITKCLQSRYRFALSNVIQFDSLQEFDEFCHNQIKA